MLSRGLVEYFMKKNDIAPLKDEVLHTCDLQHLACFQDKQFSDIKK